MNKKQNSVSSAGAKDDSSTTAELLPSASIAANPMLAAVVLEPTCMLRLNMCRNRNGTLEQMWIDKITRKEYWQAVPSVYVNNGS
jgi:hypothetical protein